MTHLPPVAGNGLGEEPGRGDGVPGGARDGSVPLPLGLADFAEGGAGSACLPSAGLHAVLEDLSGPRYRCAGAMDEQLIGLLGRWSAVESRAAAARLAVLRELIRRRPAPDAAPPGPRGDLPQGWEEGTAHEVSGALSVSLRTADAQLDLAWELGARLPGIAAKLAGGIISELKARIVARELKVLDDDLVRRAEALILGKLAGKTPAQIAAMAASAVVRVDPEGARKRRERAEREDARVRFWREQEPPCQAVQRLDPHPATPRLAPVDHARRTCLHPRTQELPRVTVAGPDSRQPPIACFPQEAPWDVCAG